MNPVRRICLVTLVVGLAACATQPIATYEALPFDEAEYASLPTSGTGVVRGQVFATTVGGDVKKGAGEDVVLWPATSYGNQRFEEQVLRGKLVAKPADPRHHAYIKMKKTDGDGRFEFKDIPPGSYYVVSNVTWTVVRPSTLGPISSLQGGKVYAKLVVKNGEVTDAFLTP